MIRSAFVWLVVLGMIPCAPVVRQLRADELQRFRFLIEDNGSTAARVSILGPDKKPIALAGEPIRSRANGEQYFYVEGEFEHVCPAGSKQTVILARGLECKPVTLMVSDDSPRSLRVKIEPWIDMAALGWYSGDSHVHLHTGGPIAVSVHDALVAARAEGVNYVNLCVSNVVGDDIRDAELITGKPHEVSTERHLLVFGEEMRSSIYGHMQFFGIPKLVEPQYTGFANTPQHHDFPANHVMAAEAVRLGGVVTYGHPMMNGQPNPFAGDLTADHGAARELPVDAMLGVVQAVDLMSYNSDETLSTQLWYRLLNCGLKLSACAGTDALLDRSTDPLGGERVYVKLDGPFNAENWLEGLRRGRSFVTNGPMIDLRINDKGLGETVDLDAPGSVRATVTVKSRFPIDETALIVNGMIAHAREEQATTNAEGIYVQDFHVPIAIEHSSWIALRVTGPDHPEVIDGPVRAHTSPVYVAVGGAPIMSSEDAAYFVEWIDNLLRVVAARNRYARPEDRAQVEATFRAAQEKYRAMAALPADK